MKCKICGSKTETWYEKFYDDRHGYPGKFAIYKYVSCGFMQTKPRLSNSSFVDIYTKYYSKRDAKIKEIVKNSKNIPSKKEIRKNDWEATCHFQTKEGFVCFCTTAISPIPALFTKFLLEPKSYKAFLGRYDSIDEGITLL